MKAPFLNTAVALLISGATFLTCGCSSLQVVHVPPGESLNVALAKKPEVIALPPAQPAVAVNGVSYAAVEPALPETSRVELVAEAYTRGQFCMEAGKTDEAIGAFEETVKIDPTFTEAWQQLAMLYEKKGDSAAAMRAFRSAKKVAQH